MKEWGIRDGRSGRYAGPATSYKKGDVMVRGFTDTGDHVFVDKISYHFRKPKAGEVFVFDTRTLHTAGAGEPLGTTQYYIKRLVAVGPAELRIDPPFLYINGEKAKGFGYERVMQAVNGYQGYSLMPRSSLSSPTDTTSIKYREYFAMGDNSNHSLDSRAWGPVPERNLMGTGVFVYWPFGRAEGGRWGLIK
jgi:signal peptidase I